MSAITKKGRELAEKLNTAIGTTIAIEQTCSLIARHAQHHKRLAEAYCCGVPEYARERFEADYKRTEKRITELVADLPATDDGPFEVFFQHDPRGITVKLTAPAPWERLYDCFGNTGICVPQDY